MPKPKPKDMPIEALHENLKMLCTKCTDVRAIIVDRTKESIQMPILRDEDGNILKSSYFFPTYRHEKYCPYHLREKGGEIL